MSKVVILDYQLGNLFSVNQALQNIGLETRISSDPADIAGADAIVLPGVGAFGDAMTNLRRLGLEQPIKDFVASGKPFLGICLGMQLLFSESEEFGSSSGLNIIPGKVMRFNNHDSEGKVLRVPQIAWNRVHPRNGHSWDNTPLSSLKDGAFMYFVHSFYVVPDNNEVTLTQTTYGPVTYTSSVLSGNIFACQFHPEKSAAEGLSIYRKWALDNQLIK